MPEISKKDIDIQTDPSIAENILSVENTEHENRISESLLTHLAAIAESSKAAAILVYADALAGKEFNIGEKLKNKIIYVSRDPEINGFCADDKCVRVPKVQLDRIGQVKIAIFMALARGLIKKGDTIVCLAGLAGTGTLDTVIVTQVGREYELFSTSGDKTDNVSSDIKPEVIERVVSLATELGSEGREGRPVGAMFIIGDTEHAQPLTRQLILNPFRGYPEDQRNILDRNLEETIKELATIDGAFIVRGDGVVETCGAYIRTASQEEYELPRGLGARHHAAAAISAVTNAIAVTVSESTGTVTIFRAGSILTEIEKPKSSRGR